jgi:hypothetical protein
MLRGENSLMRSLDRVCNYQFGFLDWGTSRLETKPFGPRFIACSGVAALLEDWPSHFVAVCRKAGIRANHLIGSSERRSCFPFWLQQVIDFDLEHTKPQTWRSRPESLSVSTLNKGKLAADFFACIDRHIKNARTILDRWYLARDRTIILAICLNNLPVEEVRRWCHRSICDLTIEESASSLMREMPPQVGSDLSRCIFLDHLNWFISFDACARNQLPTNGSWLFCSAFKLISGVTSIPVSTHAVRRRVTAIQSELGWALTHDSLRTLRDLFLPAYSDSHSDTDRSVPSATGHL